MSQSTKNMLQRLSSFKSATNTVVTTEKPASVPGIPLNKSPNLTMAEALANCMVLRKDDPDLTPF